MKFIVIESSDGGHLYHQVFNTYEEALACVEDSDYKMLIIKVAGSFEVEDHT